MALRKGWPLMAGRLLQLSKIIERRLWGFENPLRQFTYLPVEILQKIEAKKLSLDMLREASATDIGQCENFPSVFLHFNYFIFIKLFITINHT